MVKRMLINDEDGGDFDDAGNVGDCDEEDNGVNDGDVDVNDNDAGDDGNGDDEDGADDDPDFDVGDDDISIRSILLLSRRMS